jgi:hypothetical protein
MNEILNKHKTHCNHTHIDQHTNDTNSRRILYLVISVKRLKQKARHMNAI